MSSKNKDKQTDTITAFYDDIYKEFKKFEASVLESAKEHVINSMRAQERIMKHYK